VGLAKASGFACVLLGAAFLATPPASASFPGENGKIAFARNGDIWTIEPNGSGLTQITSGPDVDSEPKWSPGGSAIVFTRQTPDSRHIYIFDLEHGLTRFGTSTALERGAAWAPDGLRLVYVHVTRFPDGFSENDLFVGHRDGTGVTRIYRGFALSPDWSPLGTRIAYVQSFDGPALLSTIRANGTDPLGLSTEIHDITDSDFDPSWSPDGLQIAFARHRGEPPCNPLCPPYDQQIFRIDATGGGLTQLSPDTPVRDVQPAWSPDGTMIAFERVENDLHSIYTMDSDGSNAQQLIEGVAPDWQPVVPPRILSAPRVAGVPRAGHELTATRGEWLATPEVTYSFQWKRCGNYGGPCTEIPGATASSYIPVEDDAGHPLRVFVAATNQEGSSTAWSLVTPAIGLTFTGTPGPDRFIGTTGNDLLLGLGGSDVLVGGFGADILYGGPGADWLLGNAGKDIMKGGRGADHLNALDGLRDVVDCGPGPDVVQADRRDLVGSNCEVVHLS
jgi:Tol biopolymer transport system component